MEAFSLLKFWRYASPDTTAGGVSANVVDPITSPVDDVRSLALEMDVETDDEEEDSFFDLVFTAPDCYDKQLEETKPRLMDSPKSVILDSPKTGVYFNGKKVVPLDSSNSKPQSPISLLRSSAVPKFRVFSLGFKKSKPETPKQVQTTPPVNEQSKLSTAQCRRVQEVPVASTFRRDNSLRSKLLVKESSFDDFSVNYHSSNRFTKDVPKYMKLIKPLQLIASSKRYTDKVKIPSDQFSIASPSSSPATMPAFSPRRLSDEKQGNRVTGFRTVSKHLGKSRSASAMPSPVNSRRDVSLLQEDDRIQSAILHCKKSFSSSSRGCSHLSRSASEPCQEMSANPARDSSSEEQKRCSI